MSPIVIVVVCLCALYVLGREVEHYDRHVKVRTLTPSKCSHFLPDEEFDSWADIWNAKYDEDPLERWWAMDTKEPA